MPFARVKFHFDANVSDLNTELKYFKVDEDGDADEETIDGSFDEEAQKKVRDNLWHEIPLSAQFIPVKKSTDVKFTYMVFFFNDHSHLSLYCSSDVVISCSIEAQPRHGDWANGFSIDWIGLRPLLLPPRVRRMAEEGICSMHFIFNVFIINPLLTLGSFFPFILGRKDGLSEVWKVKKDDDIKDYCGACVKHCLPAEAENLGTAESRFDVFDCACFESGDLFFFVLSLFLPFSSFVSRRLQVRSRSSASRFPAQTRRPFSSLHHHRHRCAHALESTPGSARMRQRLRASHCTHLL